MTIAANNVEILRCDVAPSYKTAAAIVQGALVKMTSTNDTVATSTAGNVAFGIAGVASTSSGAEVIPVILKGKIRIDLTTSVYTSGGSPAVGGLIYCTVADYTFNSGASGAVLIGVCTAYSAGVYAEVEINMPLPSA